MQQRFEKLCEFYAAGLFEEESASPFVRFSRGVRRYLENRELPPCKGESLYPCGSFWTNMSVKHSFSFTVDVNWNKLKEKDEAASAALWQYLSAYKRNMPAEHLVGGNMYTHSFPNFRRLVREGLDSYQSRAEAMQNEDLRCGLLDVLAGIRCFHSRSLCLLRESNAPKQLVQALEKVPFRPAETLYEALVCWNFLYYMDGCDDIGRLDADLIDFYKGEDLTGVFRQLFLNIDANNGWSGALGPDYNPLTLQCLHACAGIRRPSIELRVTPDMPTEIWDAALESVKAGGGSPSFYNEVEYQSALAEYFPHIPKEDLLRTCGGGCTEMMLTGISNVGSLDAGINLALIFERFMRQELPRATDFDSFYQAFLAASRTEIIKVLEAISASQKSRAQFRPQPMRTLLIDDCIDRERDFNDGGARYCWSVVNIAGLINVLDSLLVLKSLVFTNRRFDGCTFLKHMDEGENFLHYPGIPRHGTDTEEANAMAQRLSQDICSIFDERVPYSGGRFLPSSIQFTTYLNAGKPVGATPDGRTAGAPLCDSIGAIFGNDNRGATALLNSASSLCQRKMIGTPVLNIKLEAQYVSNTLRPLVMGYFQNGGMQMQVTCVSREDMLEAQKHPEKYSNLIVRIGGYSEYFTRLTPELQQTVIDRTFAE